MILAVGIGSAGTGRCAAYAMHDTVSILASRSLPVDDSALCTTLTPGVVSIHVGLQCVHDR